MNELSDLQKHCAGTGVAISIVEWLRDEMNILIIGESYNELFCEIQDSVKMNLRNYDLVKKSD